MGSETAILDIYADCYPGVIHRSKAHEGRMVPTMGILRRTCLAADLVHSGIGTTARATCHSLAHTLDYVLVILRLDLGVSPVRI